MATAAEATAGSGAITVDELKKIWAKLDKLSGKAQDDAYNEFKKQYPKVFKIDDDEDPLPDGNPNVPAVPKTCRIKPGGWGANDDPNKWSVTKMKSDPNKWKVVDDTGKNVADECADEVGAKYFIQYYKDTSAVPTPGPGTEPNPDPDGPPPQPIPSNFPIPLGFQMKGQISTAFKHWGRHETGYASGGKGPSERWDNKELTKALNVIAGYEFKIGPAHGKRGDDNVDLKFRADGHSNSNGGWYIPFIEWNVDGSPGGAGVGEEYPHPKTSHLDFNVVGKDVTVPNIKDGKWHGFLAACFNDAKGVPTIMLWYNAKATGVFADYVLVGVSKDKGNMAPGPVCDVIGHKGKKEQTLQIRMDEVPGAIIRNAFAVECVPPANA